MDLLSLFIIAVGLSMDAFAVAICKGLSMQKLTFKKALIVGLWFGVFQAVMPLIGYFVGKLFADVITELDHWIAFGLLVLIGANMIKGAVKKDEEKPLDEDLSVKVMLPFAVATSIDALAVGVSFAFLQVNIYAAVAFIGATTLLLSMLGVKLGHIAGMKYKSKAEIVGGVILILMGVKILLEHLGVINF